MSEEILFRGKRKDNGEWVYGYFLILPNGMYAILSNAGYAYIAPKTRCQYTGLKDRNGRKIFEGDIVKFVADDGKIGVIKWENYTAQYVIKSSDKFIFVFDNRYGCNGTDLEIIGNIYDTPELLEVEK